MNINRTYLVLIWGKLFVYWLRQIQRSIVIHFWDISDIVGFLKIIYLSEHNNLSRILHII